jgi:ribosome-associated translation inhibitor RaiA
LKAILLRRNVLSLLRKVILVLVLILVGVLATVLLISPTSVLGLALSIESIFPVLRVIIALVFDAILLALIYLLFRREHVPADSTALVLKAPGAVADVSVASARERILKAVREVPDVTSADAQVQAVRGRADIELQVKVAGRAVNVPEKQRDIDRALRQVINKQLGLQIAKKPRVHIHLETDEAPTLITSASERIAPLPATPAVVAEKSSIPAVEPAPVVVTLQDVNQEPEFVKETRALDDLERVDEAPRTQTLSSESTPTER